jgi:hypothetical protein
MTTISTPINTTRLAIIIISKQGLLYFLQFFRFFLSFCATVLRSAECSSTIPSTSLMRPPKSFKFTPISSIPTKRTSIPSSIWSKTLSNFLSPSSHFSSCFCSLLLASLSGGCDPSEFSLSNPVKFDAILRKLLLGFKEIYFESFDCLKGVSLHLASRVLRWVRSSLRSR